MIVCQLHDDAQQLFYLELILKVFVYKFLFFKPKHDFTKEKKIGIIKQTNLISYNQIVDVYRALVGFLCK